jgi:hypothetical protein
LADVEVEPRVVVGPPASELGPASRSLLLALASRIEEGQAAILASKSRVVEFGQSLKKKYGSAFELWLVVGACIFSFPAEKSILTLLSPLFHPRQASATGKITATHRELVGCHSAQSRDSTRRDRKRQTRTIDERHGKQSSIHLLANLLEFLSFGRYLKSIAA